MLENRNTYSWLGIPMLPEVRDRLAVQYSETRLPSIRDRVIDAQPTRKLVKRIVADLVAKRNDADDGFVDGIGGAIQALELYNPKRGAKFTTYAYSFIYFAIMKGVRDRSSIIHLPRGVREQIDLLNKIVEALLKELGRDPVDTEILTRLHWSYEDLEKVRQWRDLSVSSIVAPDDEGNEIQIPAPGQPTDDDAIITADLGAAKQVLTQVEREAVDAFENDESLDIEQNNAFNRAKRKIRKALGTDWNQ